MQTQQVTGPTIQAALKEARRRFGDDVVLIESMPPEENQPARITVMVDTALPASKQPSTPSGPPGSSGPHKPARALGYGPGMRKYTTSSSEGTAAASPEKASDASVDVALDTPPQPNSNEGTNSPPGGNGLRSLSSPGRNRIFSSDARPSTSGDASSSTADRLLEAQLQHLHSRLESMERRFGGALIGSTQRWMANPLFAELMDQGLRPATITKLFDRLVDRGFEPESDPEDLRWAAAQELRRMLNVKTPKRSAGTVLVVGPSGAGKTSLLLKLATHEQFFARRQPTVISIVPDDRSIPYQNPAELYRTFGVPVQNVCTEGEMDQALDRAEGFEQILIDTPPLPTQEETARTMLRRIKCLVSPLMPLQVHLILSAARNLHDFDTDFLHRLPLQPDAVALTHLDESSRWGHVAEWLLEIGKPIQFVSTGSRVPEGVEAFSPTWYVEEMLAL